jgi:hypothetical protein
MGDFMFLHSFRSDDTNFSTERVMEAVAGRTQGYLMEEFCKLLHEADIADPPDVFGDLSEEQRLTLHLLMGGKEEKGSRDSRWMKYFIGCLKWNKHCLGLIVVRL